MIVNQAALAAVKQSFNTIFNEQVVITEAEWNKIAMLIPSTGASNDYPSLSEVPMLREWLGDRQIKNLEASVFTIKNRDFEATVGVARNHIKDGALGIYRPMLQEMGRNAVLHPDSLIFDLLKNGFSNLGHDGQFFFDTDHPVNGASVANTDGGAGAPWFLMDMNKPIKPLIFQSRESPEFVALDNPKDAEVFKKKKFLYGVDYRGNAGYGMWELAWGSKQALNEANYEIARSALMSMKNAEGVPRGIVPNLLVCAPTLEGAARELLKTTSNAAGATNKWFGTAEVLVSTWLA